MLHVTSPQNPTIKLIRSLAEKKHRQEHGLFVAEGEQVLHRACAEGWEPVYLLSTTHAEPWDAAALLRVDEKIMGQVSAQKNPPDQIGVFRQRWVDSVKPEGVWVALEDMRDPGNLGAIIRTADAAGAAGVILAGQSCEPWSPDCVRATMGSIFAMPLVRMEQKPFLDLLRAWPGESVGTHLKATGSYRRPYKSPTLLVMGSEGRGLSEEAAAACATLVRIPMKGGAQSLNVAIATGLMLFEAQKL
ncbi:RNA methyltransferase [Aestuariivirga sp.]|uniref:TrmH family RNA methyltransferase n=1 Tax=Aestuariivirga sp. TaxID=2650926 RepID=UPI0025C28B53|nr:RNA methyltransferase [Aestuariivirga sp.]MCA3556375.1 RNA methyltransferase [Aestuariivirga sp.]